MHISHKIQNIRGYEMVTVKQKSIIIILTEEAETLKYEISILKIYLFSSRTEQAGSFQLLIYIKLVLANTPKSSFENSKRNTPVFGIA